MSFTEKLSPESLAAFNEAAKRDFSQQAIFFLNAFWDEYGDQAEYIYSVITDTFRIVDMQSKGIKYIHQYDEGEDLDFDMGLYLFELLCKFADEPNRGEFKHRGPFLQENKDFKETFAKSIPAMMTSIVRKKELREKVDVNFDGRVGMLEYLLYQYEASPKDLMDRSARAPDEDPAIRKAREALALVTKAVNAYEAEKQRLTEKSLLPGVKGLTAKNQLAQLNSSPLWENLNRALITAEAAVRIATKKAKARGANVGGGGDAEGGGMRDDGAVWWLNRDLAEKKAKYGPKKK